jgi:hypothetical protein
MDVASVGSERTMYEALDLSNTRPQYLALDPNDGFVDVLLRQEPDDEEDDDEDEDRSHDENEDDDYENDDGYSERPSARRVPSKLDRSIENACPQTC